MSSLRVSSVDVTVVEGPRPWYLLHVETEDGITGVGEIPPTRHAVEDIERLGEVLIGRDPFETERLFGAAGELGAAANDIFTTTITGGFDIACWDIKGKQLGVPVHELLGGKLRNELRGYANGWDFEARRVVERYHEGEAAESVLEATIDEITSMASEVVKAGYTALKFSPFQWGDGPTTSQLELDNAIRVIEAVAETVPSRVEILVEGHKHLAVDKALRTARRLEPIDPGFYEEPVPADLEGLRRISEQSSVPIATGESFTTHHAFQNIARRTEVSVLQPDIVRAGGITELWKIAALASAESLGLAPHNAGGPVMTVAAAHVDAVTPAFMIQETFEEFYHPAWGTDLLRNPLAIEDGVIHVPDRPGLGVEFDEDVLAEHDITQRM